MKILAGTSGFAYDAWKGSFYPDDLAKGEMLAHYGRRLPAVEINNTFYRMPKKNVLESWAADVPEGFAFSIKASRKITHFAKLQGADDAVAFLTGNVELLGPKLGALLFQLPPYLKKDAPLLTDFLALLPSTLPVAFEFRSSSWNDAEIHQLLADRNVAWVVSETDEKDAEIVPTANWGYLRLRRTEYDEDRLADWRRRISEQEWDRAVVFFKHEDAGTGPALAKRFLDLDP